MERIGPERAEKLFNEYKVWAFRTAQKLMLNRGKTEWEAFAHAIIWTADSSGSVERMSDRELIGFGTWHNTVKRPGWIIQGFNEG